MMVPVSHRARESVVAPTKPCICQFGHGSLDVLCCRIKVNNVSMKSRCGTLHGTTSTENLIALWHIEIPFFIENGSGKIISQHEITWTKIRWFAEGLNSFGMVRHCTLIKREKFNPASSHRVDMSNPADTLTDAVRSIVGFLTEYTGGSFMSLHPFLSISLQVSLHLPIPTCIQRENSQS